MGKIVGLGHVGFLAKDPTALAAFYRDLFGMEVIGQASADHPRGAMAFLSARPGEEHHELAFFHDRQRPHVAFKVASLADLRACYREVKGRRLPIRAMINHYNSLAFSFPDPEGNLIEGYWDTGRRGPVPYIEPIDLELPDEALLTTLARTPAT